MFSFNDHPVRVKSLTVFHLCSSRWLLFSVHISLPPSAPPPPPLHFSDTILLFSLSLSPSLTLPGSHRVTQPQAAFLGLSYMEIFLWVFNQTCLRNESVSLASVFSLTAFLRASILKTKQTNLWILGHMTSLLVCSSNNWPSLMTYSGLIMRAEGETGYDSDAVHSGKHHRVCCINETERCKCEVLTVSPCDH